MATATLLGAPRGFFIPYRYRGLGSRGLAEPPYTAAASALEAMEAGFAALLDDLESVEAALLGLGREPAPAPRWSQDWFPRLDGAMAYALVRRRRPQRIMEVGSGHSTRFLVRAVQDEGLATHVTAIDPAPRASLRGLQVEWRSRPVQDCDPAEFAALQRGDILFIDSSHVLMPGTDVDFLLNRVIPSLRPGVLLHLHDIFLPDSYPGEWAWRGYNEQLAVLPLLTGGQWRVLFASHYAATRMKARLQAGVVGRLPLPVGAFESSLWLERGT